jgi:DNA-binding transcriptional MocR family regulator
VAETLETGELQRFVYDTLQPTYCKRYRKMVEVINKELIPLGVRLPQTDRQVVGGYFIWLTLPAPLQGAVLAQRAKEEENVVVAQGEIFEVSLTTTASTESAAHKPRCPATPTTPVPLSAVISGSALL